MKNIPKKYVVKIKIFYTYAFNIYAWYWLYKLIFVLPFDWENIIAWTFACLGMWFFVLDSNDPHFRKEMSKTIGYPDLDES